MSSSNFGISTCRFNADTTSPADAVTSITPQPSTSTSVSTSASRCTDTLSLTNGNFFLDKKVSDSSTLAYFDGDGWNVADSETNIVDNITLSLESGFSMTTTKIFNVVVLTIPRFGVGASTGAGVLKLCGVGGLHKSTIPKYKKSYLISISDHANNQHPVLINVFPDGMIEIDLNKTCFPNGFSLNGDVSVVWVIEK